MDPNPNPALITVAAELILTAIFLLAAVALWARYDETQRKRRGPWDKK